MKNRNSPGKKSAVRAYFDWHVKQGMIYYLVKGMIVGHYPVAWEYNV